MAALESMIVSPAPESEWLSHTPDETPVPISLDLLLSLDTSIGRWGMVVPPRRP